MSTRVSCHCDLEDLEDAMPDNQSTAQPKRSCRFVCLRSHDHGADQIKRLLYDVAKLPTADVQVGASRPGLADELAAHH